MAQQLEHTGELNDTTGILGGARRSGRDVKPTEKYLQYRDELCKVKQGEFSKAYESFKTILRKTREDIKQDLSEEELYDHKLAIESEFVRVEKAYDGLRTHVSEITDFPAYQRRIDSAAACRRDMVTHLSYRVTDIGVKDFDISEEIQNLRELKKPYAASLYSTATLQSSHHSERSAKAIEAAADLAVSQVRCKALEAQEEEELNLAKMEAAVAAQRHKLELLKAQQEVVERDVKFRVLSVSVEDGNASETAIPHILHQTTSHLPFDSLLNPGAAVFSPHAQPCVNNIPVGTSNISESSLATAFANAMDRIRLPVPTPKVFSGDPIEFVNFKRSFKSLIENKGVPPGEKIYLSACLGIVRETVRTYV